MSLGDYVKPLVSDFCQWITFLTLSNVTVSRRDIINLSILANLGALTIGAEVLTPDVGLDDNIVRAWARAAAEANAFSLLRVLNLRKQKHLTPRAFQHLHNFPSLALLILDDCSIGPKDRQAAMNSGWSHRTRKMLNGFLPELEKVVVSWDSVVHACFRAGGAYAIENLTAEGVEALNALPVLHFNIGAVTSDAQLNAGGNYRLQCFERIANWSGPQSSFKRSSDAAVPSEEGPRKKPMLRASKNHTTMGDLLSGFGT